MKTTTRALFVLIGYLGWTVSLCFAFTGIEWKNLPPIEKKVYVKGIVDGWAKILRQIRAEQKMGLNPSITDESLVRLAICWDERKMSYDTMESLIEQYLKEHPSKREKEIATSAYAAVYLTCNQKK